MINLYKGLDASGTQAAIMTPEVGVYDPITKLRLKQRLQGIQGRINLLEEGTDLSWGLELKETESTDWSPLLGNENAWQSYRRKIGRYFLETSTLKAYRLKSDDATKLASTGETVDLSKGNIVTIAPALYYKMDSETNTLWMSEVPIGGHVIETDKVNHLCVYGTYLAYETGGKLKSWHGYKPSASRTISTFWSQAQAENTGYGLIDYDFWKWLMMMGLSEFKGPDARYRNGLYGMSGTGNTWSVANSKPTGETAYLNNVFGKVAAPSDVLAVNSNACHVLIANIEDPYSCYWQMTQGVYFGNSSNSEQSGSEIFIYEGNRMPSSSELTTHPEGTYRQLTRFTGGGDYAKTLLKGEFFDIFMNTGGASVSTYWCTRNYGNTTGQLLLWGGSSYHGAPSGLGCSYSANAFSHANSDYGSRLAFYGTVAGIV